MIKIYPETKVYIACPANIATGGPELLHQLCYHLRSDMRINAIMYYFGYNKKINHPFIQNMKNIVIHMCWK